MTPISPGWLIALYLLGWIPMIYIGMCLNNRVWRKREDQRVHAAYQRGFKSGHAYLDRINEAKTERDSSVKIKDPTT